MGGCGRKERFYKRGVHMIQIEMHFMAFMDGKEYACVRWT